MAISGLVSLLVIIGYWHHEDQKRVLESYDYLYEVKEIGIEIEYLSEYLDYYRISEKDEAKAKKFFIDKNKEIDIRNLQKEKAQELSEYYQGLAGVYGFSLLIGFFLSASLSIAGFGLWYFRVQMFQDLELAEKSTKGGKRTS